LPIELSSAALGGALARLGEQDLEAPRDVEGALEWMAGREDPEAPLLLRRYDLQVFLWYQLPRKWLIPLDDKRRVAARLGRFLDLVGGRAGDYAGICTSEETMRLLSAWEEDDPGAGPMLRNALDASGIEPPDTDALEWSSVMGLEEARLRDRVAFELEQALDQGRLRRGERGFERRRADFVSDWLLRPRAELDGRAAIDLISEERLTRWLERGSDERRAILAGVAPLLRELEPAEAPSAPEPLTWLLDAARERISLTQTGALNRALVRASVERFPGWWDGGLHGPPHREDDVFSLCEVHQLARRLRLLRRRGRRLLLTRRGEQLREDPQALFRGCARKLIASDGFEAAAQELAAAVLLSRETVDRDLLERELHAAIVAEGWNAGGELPAVWEVARAAGGLLRVTEALGLVEYRYEWDRETLTAERELRSTAAGREALRLALGSRALGPARWP
jgi:hypothetical protein